MVGYRLIIGFIHTIVYVIWTCVATQTNVSRGREFAVLTADDAGFRKDSQKFVFYLPTGTYSISPSTFLSYMKKMKEHGINYSEVHTLQQAYGGSTTYMRDCVQSTGGDLFTDNVPMDSEIYHELCEHVTKNVSKPNQMIFEAVTAIGYQKINLGSALSSTSGYDKDQDGLSNWEEVNTDLLVWYKDGTVGLPTLKYCIENYSESSYVKEGLDRIMYVHIENENNVYDAYQEFMKYINSVRILPIFSNPCEKDSDGDGYSDIEDIKPLDSYNNGKTITDLSIEEVTLIQKSLEKLGYFSIGDDKYGEYGGRTRAAIQLYQLNHSFALIKYGEYYIDINTFSYIVNDAVNHGLRMYTNQISSPREVYDDYAKAYNLNEKYYEVCRIVPPILTDSQVKYGVDAKMGELPYSDEKLYYLDYSESLNLVMYEAEKEFHFHDYECSMFKNSDIILSMNFTPLEYEDSQLMCYPSNKDLLFLFFKVKNEAKYDIKRREVWNVRMEELGREVYFYGPEFLFHFNDYIINAEDFGNILFGALGNAGGYGLRELQNGGSIYSLIHEHHLDDENDTRNIGIGYNIYEVDKYQYIYLHKGE